MADTKNIRGVARVELENSSQYTNDDLRAAMDVNGIEYAASDTKPQLVDKILSHEWPADTSGSSGWGAPAASNNGGGSTEPAVVESKDAPQSAATQPASVENADPAAGQGRAVSLSPDVDPADAPVGAAPQADANTPAHHDASTAGSGPGGTAPDAETAERTGAPIADGQNGDSDTHVEMRDVSGRAVVGVPGYDPNNPDAFSGEGATEAAPTLAITSEPPSMVELLNNAAAVDAAVANSRQEAAAKPKEAFVPPKPLTEPIDFEPHPNEKVTDAIGSTHDASGREIVASRGNEPDGPGVPVYVGTAQPVANPDAGWRSNA